MFNRKGKPFLERGISQCKESALGVVYNHWKVGKQSLYSLYGKGAGPKGGGKTVSICKSGRGPLYELIKKRAKHVEHTDEGEGILNNFLCQRKSLVELGKGML